MPRQADAAGAAAEPDAAGDPDDEEDEAAGFDSADFSPEAGVLAEELERLSVR